MPTVSFPTTQFAFIETPVLIALLGAGASLVLSCVTAYFSYRAKIKESELSDLNAEKKARRDYEYDARKRLYSECEPLLFELYQLSLGGMKRVGSLARTAREGNLTNDLNSWLSDDGYYMLSTIYKLFAPLALVKIIQRRITLVDLSLDSRIKRQYLLANNLYQTFSSDFKLASLPPPIPYDPDSRSADYAQKVQEKPHIYKRQGLPVGLLDNVVDALIVSDKTSPARCLSFGEFETKYQNKASDVHKTFASVVGLFLNFHPATRPVLWRILITQLHLNKAILAESELDFEPHNAPHALLKIPTKDRLGRYDWRSKDSTVSDSDLEQPFDVAEKFLNKRLGKMFSEE